MNDIKAAKAGDSGWSACNPALRMLQALSLWVLLAALIPSAWSATYYVANSGNDASSGTTLSSPFKTVQKAMNVAVGGDTVYVRGGTYREEVSVTRGGGSAGKYVNLFAYNNEVPVIKGSELVTGWVKHSGNIWKKTGWVTNSQQVFTANKDTHSLQQIGMPSRFYDAFKFPSPIGSGVSSMTAGSFYYDAGGKTLYIWLADGSDPNTQPIEVSIRRRLLYMAVPYIHVKGIAFRHTSLSAFGEQGSAVELSSYSIIEKCDIQYTDFAGLNMGYLKTGSLAIGNNVSNNGNSGINAAGTLDFRVSNNIMNGNNTRNFNPLWHAGGFKAAAKAYGKVEFNEVGYNKGSGIWFDYANGPNEIVINNNYIHDNGPKDSAIFFEVSKNGLIYNNVIVNNERRGIYLSGADNTRVFNNTIVGTRSYAAIELGGVPRPNVTLKNNAVYNNIVSQNTSRYDLTIATANGTTVSGNTSNNNSFYRASGAIQLFYGSMHSTLESWSKATKLDLNSISGNPGFVAPKVTPAATDYALQATSPVIDKGMSLSAVPHDYAMTSRAAGTPLDIGAFELAGAVAPPSDKDVTAPVVKILTPTQGAGVSGSLNITASASDNVAVTNLNLYVNGALKAKSTGEQVAFTWNTAGLREGSYSIWVSAMDGAKNVGKQSITVRVGAVSLTPTAPSGSTSPSTTTPNTATPAPTGPTSAPAPGPTAGKDTVPPVVTISPGQGAQLSGAVNISASASDNVKVTALSLYVDGALKARSAGSQVSFDWNTAGLRRGTHSIWVSAMDGSNNLGKHNITVQVR